MATGWHVATSPEHEDAGKSCSASTATASATSARCISEGAKTNSSGVWAPPPRGPSPSIVSGIVAAKWLASLAPPRLTPAIGRPRRSQARSMSPAVAAARVHPAATGAPSSRSSATPPISGGIAASTESNASSRSARMSNTSSPAAGTTLSASPERIRVGTTLSRSVPPGSWCSASSSAARASASEGVAPLIRSAARMGCPPRAASRSVPAAFRRTTTPSVAVARPLAGLEAEARVVAGEPLDVGELDGAPLLVGDEQHRQLAEQLGAGGQRRGRPRAQHDAPLHVRGARAVETIAVPAERRVGGVADDRVEVAQQHHPPRARPAEPRDQIRGAVRGRARHALDLGARAAAARRTPRSPPPRRRCRRRARRRRRAPPARAQPERRSPLHPRRSGSRTS